MSRVGDASPGVTIRTLLLISLLALPGTAALAQPDLERSYRAGVEAFRAGRTHQALELLGAVEAADPGYRDVQLLLGQACLVAGLHLPAKRHFERALAADPANGHAAFLLGLSLHLAARYFEAAETLGRAHELAPQNPHPLIYRGLALLRLGRPGEARGAIEAALARAPGEPTARAALAELELAEGRLEEAERLVRQVLDEAPTPESRILLGRVVLAAGRPAEAAVIFRGILASGSERADVLYLLAQSLLRGGETEAGRAAMERFQARKALEERVRVLEAALKTDPGDLESRIRLVRLLLDHRQPAGALLHLATLRELAPGDPRIATLGAELERLRAQAP